MAEDARIITVKKIGEETLASERQAGAEREALAESGRAAAQDDAARVARDAETARIAAQVEADRVQRRENAAQDGRRAGRRADRLKRQNDAQGGCRADRGGPSEKQNDASRLPHRPKRTA